MHGELEDAAFAVCRVELAPEDVVDIRRRCVRAQCGYREVRLRRGVPYGKNVNDIRVMVKPLAGGSLADYLAAVARDRPE